MLSSVLKSKKVIISAVIIFLLLSLMIMGVVIAGNQKEKQTMSDKLVIAEKYLSELKYEEAILVFEEIIKIDPRNIEAYMGIAEAYVALEQPSNAITWLEKGIASIEEDKSMSDGCENLYIKQSEIYQSIDEQDLAQASLQRGYKFTKFELFLKLLEDLTGISASEWLSRMNQNVTTSERKEDKVIPIISEKEKDILDDLWEAAEKEDYLAVYNIIKDEPYLAFINTYGEYLPLYYDGEELTGKITGTGLNIIQDILLYYGDMIDGNQQGSGTIIWNNKAAMGDDSYTYFQGEWSDGFPNGYGKFAFYAIDRYPEEQNLYRSIITEGMYIDGWANGNMTETMTESDGITQRVVHFNTKDGKIQPGDTVSYSEDGKDIIFYDDQGNMVKMFSADATITAGYVRGRR